MLNPQCQAFRQDYSPHDPAFDNDSHRAQCEACAAYAQRLQDAADPPHQGLSISLKRRLAAIPSLAMDCQDIDLLYAATRRKARGLAVENPAARDHLSDCSRCQALYGCLEDALAEEQHQLPDRLFKRLRQIGRGPAKQLPIWIADTRYATAACYLITALLVLLAGDSSARFQATTEGVGASAISWLDQGFVDTVQGIGQLGGVLRDGLDDGRDWLTEQSDALRQSLTESTTTLHDRYRQLDLDPRHWFDDEDPPASTLTEGESDGRS